MSPFFSGKKNNVPLGHPEFVLMKLCTEQMKFDHGKHKTMSMETGIILVHQPNTLGTQLAPTLAE